MLVDGPPALSAAQVSSLVSPSPTPRFREGLISFGWRAAMGRLDQSQIENEVTAQVRKLQAAGITVSHLDSHKHTHIFPVVLRGMLRAAGNCGVRAIRNPFEPLVFATVGSRKRQFQLRILQGYRASFRKELAKVGMVTPDGCIGIAVTGGLTLPGFQWLLENLPAGTWELVTHPGHNDVELDGIKTRLRDSREKELAILTSDAAKESLLRAKIELISYRDLAAG
jgi:chitin disaccharide deacetylase